MASINTICLWMLFWIEETYETVKGLHYFCREFKYVPHQLNLKLIHTDIGYLSTFKFH